MKLSVIFLLFLLQSVVFPQSNFWQQTAGPYAGNVHGIGIHPSGRIFAGVSTSYGFGHGLYFTDNNGASWTKTSIPDNAYSVGIGANGDVYTSIGGATYKSTDIGITWVQIGLPTFRVLISTSTTDLVAATAGGVYRSTNNGDTWTPIGPSGANVLALTVDTNGYIFAGTQATTPPPQPHEYGQVYRSTDSGVSWSVVLNVQFNAVLSLTRNPTGLVFAGTNGVGIYRSTDDGGTWVNVNSGLTNAVAWAMTSDSSGNIFAGTGGGGVFRSQNNGSSWTQVGLAGKNVLSLVAGSNNHLHVGLYFEAGFYLSTNSGDAWTWRGMPLTAVWALTVDRNGTLFSGVYGGYVMGGAYRSTNRGDNWTQINTGLTYTWVSSLAADSVGVIYAGAGGVLRSTNQGSNWTQTSLTSTSIYSLLIRNQHTIFAGDDDSGHIYRSTDSGNSWSIMHSNALATFVHGLAMGSNGSVYAGIFGEGVIASTNNGESWTSLNTPNNNVETVCLNSSGHIFVGTWRDGVFRSTDNGSSWTQNNNGLSNNWVWTIVRNSIDHLYAGTIGGGVCRSTDNGDSWVPVNSGLTIDLAVRGLAFDTDEYLYAALGSGGVCRSVASTLTDIVPDQTRPSTFSLDQNYPNPFNPKTTIRFSLSSTRQTIIKVFDLLGRQIATLHDGRVEAGNYSVEWDASSLSSGVYLYRIQTGDWAETKKMLLLK